MRHWKWKTSILCLLLSSVIFGIVCWRDIRNQATGKESEAVESPVPVTVMSPGTMDDLFEKMWQAVELTARQQDPDGSLLALTKILDALDIAAIGSMLDRCDQLPKGERTAWLQRTLIQRAMVMDPAFALERACALGAGVADKLLEPMIAEWKLQNPQAAADWFSKAQQKLPGQWKLLTAALAPPRPDPNAAPADLNSAWESCRARLEAAKPAAGLAIFGGGVSGTSFQPTNSGELWPIILWARESGDWNAALAKMDTFDDSARIAHQKALLYQWSMQNWKEFHKWLTSHPLQGLDDVFDSAAQNFLHPCVIMVDGFDSSKDAQKYADFVECWEPLMSNPARQMMGVDGLGVWAAKDPNAASTWLNKRAKEPWRDRAAAALAVAVVENEPESAYVWAQSIKDDSARESALVRCWERWRTFQPTTADTWMDQHVSGFDEMKQRVRSR